MEQQRSARTARTRPDGSPAAPSSPVPAPSAPERENRDRLPRPGLAEAGGHRAGGRAGRPRHEARARRSQAKAREQSGSLPRTRLTGLGSGLLAGLLMILAGAGDAYVLGGSPTVYGASFVLVSTVSAVFVRPTELLAAPVAAPLAFVAGLLFLNEGAPGLAGQLFGIFTALALQAQWLYAGTAAALLVVLVRKTALLLRRARARRARRRSR